LHANYECPRVDFLRGKPCNCLIYTDFIMRKNDMLAYYLQNYMMPMKKKQRKKTMEERIPLPY